MKASIMRQAKMQMGSKSNMNGGGGKGGSTSGSISNDTVSPINRYNDSSPKYPDPTANNLLDETDGSYSTFLLPSFLNNGSFPQAAVLATVETDPLPTAAALLLKTAPTLASGRGRGGNLLDFLSAKHSGFVTVLESSSLPLTLNTRQLISNSSRSAWRNSTIHTDPKLGLGERRHKTAGNSNNNNNNNWQHESLSIRQNDGGQGTDRAITVGRGEEEEEGGVEMAGMGGRFVGEGWGIGGLGSVNVNF